MATNGNVASSTEYQLRKYLLLLATLVATVTYIAGLNLPGGVWQDTQSQHPVGDPILPDAYRQRYLAFYYCNATAFAASLVVCLLLLVLDKQSSNIAAVLRVVMVLDLLGLMGAYAAGSCRDLFTTIYSVVILSTVFVYILAAFFIFVISKLPTKKNINYDEKDKSNPDENKLEELREVLMLLTTFIVTITYVAGLNPPGGFWGNTEADHLVSFPILQKHHPQRYQAFFICNTTAFVASLLIIILLVDKKLSRLSPRFVALYVFIIIALFGLVGAYTAGSSREHDNTAYVIGLGIAVLAYIFLQVAITKAIHRGMKNKSCSQVLLTASCVASKCQQMIQSLFFVCTKKDTKDESRGIEHDQALEKARDLVMLLATLVASITYQAGLDPPGGLWPDDRDGHMGGDSVLLTTHPTRYKVFFYSNSAAFVVSLVVIMMVESRFLFRRHTLEAAMLMDLFGLICAYAAGSCRDVSTSIYVVSLAGVVLVYVVIHIIFFTLDYKDKPGDIEEMDNKREVLLLLAILTATLTYQAGLTPPGGFWSANDKSGHYAGFPVLLDNYPHRYKTFFYCNTASFMVSMALILLLVNPNLYRLGIRCYALYVCSVVGMFSLVGAYVAGSSRHLRTSIYVLVLAIAVFAFVIMQVLIFWRKRKNSSHSNENANKLSTDGTGSLVVKTSYKGGYQSYQQGDDEIHETRNELMAQGSAFDQGQGGTITMDVPSTPGGSSTSQNSFEQAASNKSNRSGSRKKELREYLMLLGILAANITYQAGLKPPGGLWQDDKRNVHDAGDPILHGTNKHRYLAFFYSNSTSFMASIVVIVLLLPSTLHSHQLPLWPMHTAILLDMLGLLAAYAAGSNRDMETTMKVIALIIPVLAYIAAYPALSFFGNMARLRCGKKTSQGDDKDAKNLQTNVSSSA
uniref:PGG domain-containing protein n=1 Tax=Leersia perrieri TaxID=77586 RepID=A0A0D9XI43_9ORYZ